MNKTKYTILTIFVVSAALILPALPAIADRDDKSEHPGLHKGWEKKHYGWEKNMTKSGTANTIMTMARAFTSGIATGIMTTIMHGKSTPQR